MNKNNICDYNYNVQKDNYSTKINVNNIVKCDVCETSNNKNTHYCINCGNNLSDKTELTDILLFLSYFLNGVILVIVIPFLALSSILRFWDGVFGLQVSYTTLLIGALILVIIPKLIKQIAIILCKKNLKKIDTEVNNGRN